MGNIIVTGARGFVGSYICELLFRSEYDLILIDRYKSVTSQNSAMYFATDMTKDSSIEECATGITKADIMIHLAANISVPGNMKSMCDNLSMVYSAVEIAKATGVRHFIYLSSIPVIGAIRYIPIDEDHPVFPKTQYHLSKYVGEKMISAYRDLFETISIIRISSPIGRGMRENNLLSYILSQIKHSREIELFGEGERVQNYIDVRDIAEAVMKIIIHRSDGLYLIAGKQSVSNKELVSICRGITSSDVKVVKGMQPDLEEENKWIISTNKARRDFGYSPLYSLEESIAWIWEGIS